LASLANLQAVLDSSGLSLQCLRDRFVSRKRILKCRQMEREGTRVSTRAL